MTYTLYYITTSQTISCCQRLFFKSLSHKCMKNFLAPAMLPNSHKVSTSLRAKAKDCASYHAGNMVWGLLLRLMINYDKMIFTNGVELTTRPCLLHIYAS